MVTAAATRSLARGVVVSRARRPDTRHGNRRRDDDRGRRRERPESPSAIWRVSRCRGNPGTWRFRKRVAAAPADRRLSSTTRRRKPRLTSLSPPLASDALACPRPMPRSGHRRLIRGINSARVTKNRGGETAARFTMSRVAVESRFPSRAEFHVTYFPPCYAEFLFLSPPPPPAPFSFFFFLPTLP